MLGHKSSFALKKECNLVFEKKIYNDGKMCNFKMPITPKSFWVTERMRHFDFDMVDSFSFSKALEEKNVFYVSSMSMYFKLTSLYFYMNWYFLFSMAFSSEVCIH